MRTQSHELPRCENLDGSTLRIVPSYTEAGRHCEANCVTITDGDRTATYVPADEGASQSATSTSPVSMQD